MIFLFIIFTPHVRRFSLSNNIKVTKDDDTDSGGNVHIVLDKDSRYYLPCEVKIAIDKLNISNEFSMSHINARSLLSKFENPQILLELLISNLI